MQKSKDSKGRWRNRTVAFRVSQREWEMIDGIMFKKSMETFVEHYNMVELVEEESLMRAFQRWRKMVKEEKNM